MKKISIILSVLVLAALSACTLYMDEPDDAGRILRTGEGYDKEESITLPDDQGSITYKYSQKTIPINDEVEQYIVKVESDTILYFEGGTPDELLPEVGEMMTCSFRDRFPHAFCHKCIERTEQDGIYRCVFTKCSYGEAFAELKIDVQSANFLPAEGAKEIPTEEFDSLINEYEVAEDEDTEAASRGDYDHTTRSAFNTGPRQFKGVDKDLGSHSLSPNIEGLVGVSASVTGSVKVGGYVDISYNNKNGEVYEEYGLMGNLRLTFAVEANAGVNLHSPVAIPICGIKVDLKAVGIELGLTANPYIDIRHKVNASFQISHGFDIGVVYSNKDTPKGNLTSKKSSAKKQRGMPVFRILTRDAKAETKAVLSFRGGIDFRLGVGGEAIGTGFDLAAGTDLYTELNLELDHGEYQSAEEFKQKYEKMPVFYESYVEGTVKAFYVTVAQKATLGPVQCGILRLPMLPVYNEGSAYFHRSDNNYPFTYKMGAKLEELGLLAQFWTFLPKALIYSQNGGPTELEETFDLKWKDEAEIPTMELTKRSNKILTNTPYIAQFAVAESWGDNKSFTIPIQDIPFAVEIPDIKIDKKNMRVSQSLTPNNATHQELSNPTKIGTKNGQLVWLEKGHAYLYRYKIDVPVIIGAPRLVKNWYIHMADKYSNSSDFSHKESSSNEFELQRLVRMTWYANSESVYLIFTPSADIQDDKGHDGGNMKFSTCDFTANYYMWLDRQYSSSDQSPDYEKSRSMYDTPWNVATTNLPFGDKPVLGDIELIPIK